MTDKVQKIREGVDRLKSQLLRGACSSQIAMETMCKEEAYNEVLAILDTIQEEPVSKDLEEAANKYAIESYPDEPSIGHFGTGDYEICVDMSGQREYAVEDFKAGAKWQKENLWKPADGDDLPEIDREVIALKDVVVPTATDSFCWHEVVFAHRPAPEGYDGKSITTGNTEHYTPKTYDKGGWNIPDIKFWLDVELPKEIEL